MTPPDTPADLAAAIAGLTGVSTSSAAESDPAVRAHLQTLCRFAAGADGPARRARAFLLDARYAARVLWGYRDAARDCERVFGTADEADALPKFRDWLATWLVRPYRLEEGGTPNVLQWDPTRSPFKRFLVDVAIFGVRCEIRKRGWDENPTRWGPTGWGPLPDDGGLPGAPGGPDLWTLASAVDDVDEAQELVAAVMDEDDRALRRLCPGLTREQRDAIRLWAMGYTYAEAHADLGVDPEDRIKRAIANLKKCVARLTQDPPA